MSKLDCKRTFYLSNGGKGKELCDVNNTIYYSDTCVNYFPPNARILGYSLVLSPNRVLDFSNSY